MLSRRQVSTGRPGRGGWGVVVSHCLVSAAGQQTPGLIVSWKSVRQLAPRGNESLQDGGSSASVSSAPTAAGGVGVGRGPPAQLFAHATGHSSQAHSMHFHLAGRSIERAGTDPSAACTPQRCAGGRGERTARYPRRLSAASTSSSPASPTGCPLIPRGQAPCATGGRKFGLPCALPPTRKIGF